jgi:hypothetical protein
MRSKKRHTKQSDAMPLPWDIATQSKRMLNDRQVIQLYLPSATRGALSMGRFGKGPYSRLPFRKQNRSCLYVEREVVAFAEAISEPAEA